MKRRLKELRERGGRVVVVDPRRTETARAADEHHFIQPGTDALFLLGLLSTLFEEGLTEPGPLAEVTDGWEDLRRAAVDFPPERVAPVVRIEASVLRRLARELAAAPKAAVYGRMGVSTQEFGGLCHWLINALNLVTGNLDRPGGSLVSNPAVDLVGRTGTGHFGRYHSRVRGLPEFGRELPVAVLAEEILTPGEGQVRALVTAAGNPVLSTPNGRQLEEALAGLEFMVSVDLYLNETTRHAHLILPPTAPLEHDHYDLVFHALAVRNTARYSPALFEPDADARHDWQIYLELGDRLARRKRPEGPFGQLRRAAKKTGLARLGPAGLLDLGLRSGPYGTGFRPFAMGLNLRRLKGAPHGIDLGPLQPSLVRRLGKGDKRIQAAPALFLEDLPRLVRRLEAGAPEALTLIGRRQVRSNNSWMHNAERLMRGKDRCTLLLHPQDAESRGVRDGDRVRVKSRVGEVEVPAEVSDEMLPGVVSLPHGWGHHRPGVTLTVASRHPGASANDLTDERQVDELSGNAVLSGVPVEVERAEVSRPVESVAQEGAEGA
jgi:anaerobic selenocysteine-containing dehydrogenase